MKPTTLGLAAVLITTSALADPATISGGKAGGTYQTVYGANLAQILKAKGHDAPLLESRGSMENLERLSKGEAQFGFAQLDAYGQYLKAGGKPLEIVAPLGKECGYLVVKKDGKVTSEKDLRRVKDATVAIGEEGSGSAITWQNMTRLVPEYKNARIVFQGGTRAINQLGTPGGPDAFLFVAAPGNLNNQLFQAVNANKNLKFVDIDKGGLDDKLPDGKPVYQFDKVSVCSGWGCGVDTICTMSYLFAGPTATDKAIQAVSDVMAMSPKTITEPK
ncbi:MAG TPA: TAXI family TRAP transporter solute-binding subunit [Candidatus Competibacteraceae bacterium]|nr:TAXI family TRAP transporter solute-binding subunit [Candidatus Competibacteraceae bacterium]HQA26049.1 TAXI family TRAP transporter solute-binding subunit [Candidatus Competibacteraceae bacterium]HQD55054.1 TAXI family TRAP transporter solute-binding subunit [Candidatus Competibacteraceae bacterium]